MTSEGKNGTSQFKKSEINNLERKIVSFVVTFVCSFPCETEISKCIGMIIADVLDSFKVRACGKI